MRKVTICEVTFRVGHLGFRLLTILQSRLVCWKNRGGRQRFVVAQWLAKHFMFSRPNRMSVLCHLVDPPSKHEISVWVGEVTRVECADKSPEATITKQCKVAT